MYRGKRRVLTKIKVRVGGDEGRRRLAVGQDAEAEDVSADTEIADVVVVNHIATINGRQDLERQPGQVAVRSQEEAGAVREVWSQGVEHGSPQLQPAGDERVLGGARDGRQMTGRCNDRATQRDWVTVQNGGTSCIGDILRAAQAPVFLLLGDGP